MNTIDEIDTSLIQEDAYKLSEQGYFYPLLMPNYAVDMIECAEERILRHENRLGRKKLLNYFADTSHETMSAHIPEYRKIIREQSWPNTARPSNLRKFIYEYKVSSLAYIDVGFEALQSLTQDTLGLPHNLYCKTLASEALRGQFGKRSPTGLDTRLHQADMQLTELLYPIFGVETEYIIPMVCSPAFPFLTCETEFMVDFIQLQKYFPISPNVEQISSAEPGIQEFVYRFVRRYLRWNISLMSALYIDLNAETLKNDLGANLYKWKNDHPEKINLIKLISKYFSNDIHKFKNIIALIVTLIELNYINLKLEPWFSFKSGIGLAHFIIFANFDIRQQFSSADIEEQKWLLFSDTIGNEKGDY
jgi:hypothetical protein